MAGARSLPASVLANWTGYAVGLIVNFFLSPLVVGHLGPSAYGVWVLLVTLTAYLGFLDLGIRSSVTRYVARAESRGDRATSIQVASTALAVFTAMAGVAVAASAALGLIAPSVFHIPAMAEATARRQDWSARLELKTRFGPDGPRTYREVLDVLGDRSEPASAVSTLGA